MPDTTELKRMPSNRRPLLSNDKWSVEAASHRQNNNYRHLEAGASRDNAKQHYEHGQDVQRNHEEGPFVFGIHRPDQFSLERYRYEAAAEDSANLCCDSEETKVRIVKGADKRGKDGKKSKKKKKDEKGKEKIKCLLMGDGAVGKTSLITSYAKNQFQYDYQPTAFDNYNVEVLVDQKPITMEICDTAGQDSLEGLRELCYPGTDVIILCFSVVQPESFRSIINRWAPGVAAIKAPLILVGTQSDLRDDYDIINELRLQGENTISEYEAKALASSLNAPYIETSSRTRTHLKDAFDAAIVAGLPIYKKKKSFWKRLFCLS